MSYRQYFKNTLSQSQVIKKNKDKPDNQNWCNGLCQKYITEVEFTDVKTTNKSKTKTWKSKNTLCKNCVNIKNLAKKAIKKKTITLEQFLENPYIVIEEDNTVTSTKTCIWCKEEKQLHHFHIDKNVCKVCRRNHTKKRDSNINTEINDIEKIKNNYVELEVFLRKVSKGKLANILKHYKVGRKKTDVKDNMVINTVNFFKKLANPNICRGGCGSVLDTEFSTCMSCSNSKPRSRKIPISEFKEKTLPQILQSIKDNNILHIEGYTYNKDELTLIAKGLGLPARQKTLKDDVVKMVNDYLKKNENKTKDIVVPKELSLEGVMVLSRPEDGYINATALCKAGGREFRKWYRLESAKEFLKELEKELKEDDVMGIHIDLNDISKSSDQMWSELVKLNMKGKYDTRGSWVHPDVAVQIAQWISPKFAIKVSRWVRQLATTGRVEIGSEKSNKELLELQKQLVIKDKEYKKLNRKHNKMLERRSYHKFKKGPAFYIISDNESGVIKYKLGIDKVDVNVRLQQHRTTSPATKLEYLVYTRKAKLLEDSMLLRFKSERKYVNHEWVYSTDLSNIMGSVKTWLSFLNVEYTEESEIDEYNTHLI